ncbi:MAG TPA: methylmalonyl-CoA epimerase [Anaerolineales bacterium]|nr:methylmalonyl-CoA epimerase [Anaerolineales bacterium]
MPEIKRIHHIAVLVEDIDQSLQFWRDILGILPSHIADFPGEAARIAFLPLGESELELVQPTKADTGLSRFLEKHGPGMHHICLQVNDLAGLLQQLKSRGVQLINDQPKLGEAGQLYAFIHPKSTQGVLVELYQLAEK